MSRDWAARLTEAAQAIQAIDDHAEAIAGPLGQIFDVITEIEAMPPAPAPAVELPQPRTPPSLT